MRAIFIAVFTATTLSCIPSHAEQKSERNEILQSVVIANMSVGVAQACGAPVEDAKRAAGYIYERLKEQQPEIAQRLTLQYIEEDIQGQAVDAKPIIKERNGSYFGKPCSYWRGLLDRVLSQRGAELDFKRAASNKRSAKTEEDSPANPQDIRKKLEKLANTLPKGKLGTIQGCWQAKVSDDWLAQLCFTKNGDEIDVDLTGPSNSRCEFRAGKARKRKDGAFFFAYSNSGRCSNGRAIEHIEGYCEPESKKQICLISIYRKANIFFLEDESDDESGLNGEFEFVRVR